jgi:hypothetical protein
MIRAQLPVAVLVRLRIDRCGIIPIFLLPDDVGSREYLRDGKSNYCLMICGEYD